MTAKHNMIVEIQRVGIEGPNKRQPFRYIRSRTAQPATERCWLTVRGDALLPVSSRGCGIQSYFVEFKIGARQSVSSARCRGNILLR